MKWKHPLQDRRIKESISDIFEIPEIEIWRNSTPWDRMEGLAEWGFYKNNGKDAYYCFNSMKSCLKYGFTVSYNETTGFEINPNDFDDF